jgi:hypothetical protein
LKGQSAGNFRNSESEFELGGFNPFRFSFESSDYKFWLELPSHEEKPGSQPFALRKRDASRRAPAVRHGVDG